MPDNTRTAALLSLAVALAAISPVRAADQWFMAANEAAVVISRDSAAAARVLMELSTARSVMQQVAVVEPLPPVRAFAVRNDAALRELVPQYWERRGVRPHGASYTGPHNGFIALRTDFPVPQQFPLLLHEYVHLLTKEQVPNAPAWLDEGLSEFWGALAFEGGRAVIGRAPAHHLKLLRSRPWLPLDDMRQRQRGKLETDRDRVTMFYAQSWAMVHYLLLRGQSTTPLAYAPLDPQWTRELDAALRVYVTAGKFREVSIQLTNDANVASAFPVPRSLGKGGRRTIPRPISEARALAERARMMVFGERPDAALPLLRRALTLSPLEPLALEVMGTHYFLRNQMDQARTWLSQALDADPGSYSSAVYLSLLSASAIDRERYLQAAVKAKPDLALAWRRLWRLYDEDGRGEQARRWCHRLTPWLQAWVGLDQALRCGPEVRR